MKQFSKNTNIILIALLFIFIAVFVIFSGLLVTTFDESLLTHIFGLRNDQFTPIVTWVTDLLAPINIILTVTIMSLFIYLSKQSWGLSLWYASVHIVGLLILNPGLKAIVERNRPPIDFRLVQETSPSFPSGHSASVVLVSLMIAFTLIHIFNLTKYKHIIISFALVFILFIGFTRMYLGVHYFTDVIAGYLVGLFSFGLGLKAYKNYF